MGKTENQKEDITTDTTLRQALRAAEIAESKKGEQVIILDMRDVTLVADYFVIASAMNVVQVQSIAEAVDEALEGLGLKRINRESRRKPHWAVLDYGALVVHIFTEEERRYYDLERLWGDAQVVQSNGMTSEQTW